MYVSPKTKAILISFNASISLFSWKDTVLHRRGITPFRITVTLYFPSQQPVIVFRRKQGFVIRNVEPSKEALRS
jgi:hypothetical protein